MVVAAEDRQGIVVEGIVVGTDLVVVACRDERCLPETGVVVAAEVVGLELVGTVAVVVGQQAVLLRVGKVVVAGSPHELVLALRH